MTRASDTAKLLGAGATILDGTTISTADNTDQLTLTSTDADATTGPNLRFYRNSASPADNDGTGQIQFEANNDAGEVVVFNDIQSKITDASDGTEDGTARFRNIVGGTLRDYMLTNGTETVFNEGSVDLDFRVESNGNANMLFVDGGNDTVVVGQSAPDTTLSGGTPAFQVIGSGFESFASLTRRVASSSGPLLILAKSRNTSVGSHTVVQNGDVIGELVFIADDGTDFDSRTASIKSEIDGAPGANDTPGRLVFMTTADGANSPTEAMRITKSQNLAIGVTTEFAKLHVASQGDATTPALFEDTRTGSTSTTCVVIKRNGSNVGAINTTNNSTSYVESSDYRLKENVQYTFDATSRLKQLKPCRFNFITDADNTVDGFLAHEVSSIVPQAITGEKDAMTDEVLYVDGDEIPEGKKVGDVKEASKIDPQGIDHSKIVPLLVKTIQELEARITTLENA